MQFEKAIFIVGPTASGKSALAHVLVDRQSELGCRFELVNIDAFQFYRGLDIGTAKPSADELRQYKYHGIDILDICESMDAARYAEFVWSSCREISKRGAIPVCVGGSGLYLRAALHGLDPLPPRSDLLREMFRASASVWGWHELHRWLSVLAPERAAELHPNDKTRIERALEIAFQLPAGVDVSSVLSRNKRLSEQKLVGDAFLVHVDCADTILKERIRQRLDSMFAMGWIDEVQRLFEMHGENFRNAQCFRAIGYPAILSWLERKNSHSLDSLKSSHHALESTGQLVETVFTQTWQYVRRQRTWNAKERRDWLVDTSEWNSVGFSFGDIFVDFLSK